MTNAQLVDSAHVKAVTSPDYSYYFRKSDGFFARWGKTLEDDPQYSPIGPELVDIEISKDGCPGFGTTEMPKLCRYCSPAGTLVNTPTGTVGIETIRPGNTVIGYDLAENRIRNQTVVEVYQHQHEGEMIVIELDNGDLLHLTPEHPIMLADGNSKPAGLLDGGEDIITL